MNHDKIHFSENKETTKLYHEKNEKHENTIMLNSEKTGKRTNDKLLKL